MGNFLNVFFFFFFFFFFNVLSYCFKNMFFFKKKTGFSMFVFKRVELLFLFLTVLLFF